MTVTEAYRNLLSEGLPHAIHTDREHRAYLLHAEELLDKKSLSAAEEQYLELLTVLIEQFEEEQHAIAAPDPLTALRELMLAKDVSQAALGRILGSSGIASEVLAGKRELSKAHIRKLVDAFDVSADLFI